MKVSEYGLLACGLVCVHIALISSGFHLVPAASSLRKVVYRPLPCYSYFTAKHEMHTHLSFTISFTTSHYPQISLLGRSHWFITLKVRVSSTTLRECGKQQFSPRLIT